MSRTIISPQPHDYLIREIQAIPKVEKLNEIVHQHRKSKEKRLSMFLDLEKNMPHVKFIICQDKKQTKVEYHQQLLTPKIAFSASLQETLGIAMCIEAPLFNIVPFAPDRLSYHEIFADYQEFLYPSNWTVDWDSYINHRNDIIEKLNFILENYQKFVPVIKHYCAKQLPKYANATVMVDRLLSV